MSHHCVQTLFSYPEGYHLCPINKSLVSDRSNLYMISQSHTSWVFFHCNDQTPDKKQPKGGMTAGHGLKVRSSSWWGRQCDSRLWQWKYRAACSHLSRPGQDRKPGRLDYAPQCPPIRDPLALVKSTSQRFHNLPKYHHHLGIKCSDMSLQKMSYI